MTMAQAEGLEPPKVFRPRRFSRPLPHPAGLPAYMASGEGFEPSAGMITGGALAGRWFQPLTHPYIICEVDNRTRRRILLSSSQWAPHFTAFKVYRPTCPTDRGRFTLCNKKNEARKT